jgi:hypothetical protein
MVDKDETQMMTTAHTTHPLMADLALTLLQTRVGETIVYATGDLSYSCDSSKKNELKDVRAMIWSAYEAGELALTQRRLPHLPFKNSSREGSFEYLATRIRTREQAAKKAQKKL